MGLSRLIESGISGEFSQKTCESISRRPLIRALRKERSWGAGPAKERQPLGDQMVKTILQPLTRQRQPKRRDHGNQGRRWSARDELRRRLPELHGELRDRSIWAIHSRDQHKVNMALDAVIANQKREDGDELPADVPQHSFPKPGDEPFNAPPEDLIDAWSDARQVPSPDRRRTEP
jgi:hypothetical protein